MKLNFNFQLKDLSGNKIMIGEANTGKILANTLCMLNKGNSVKLYDWALKLWNGKPLEIDDTDANVLIEIIETSESLTILAKAQMKQYIEEAKPKK